jgi:hypothetical protein
MNNVGESLRATDRAITGFFFNATSTEDCPFVEHFLLGNSGNALPMDEEKTGV